MITKPLLHRCFIVIKSSQIRGSSLVFRVKSKNLKQALRRVQKKNKKNGSGLQSTAVWVSHLQCILHFKRGTGKLILFLNSTHAKQHRRESRPMLIHRQSLLGLFL